MFMVSIFLMRILFLKPVMCNNYMNHSNIVRLEDQKIDLQYKYGFPKSLSDEIFNSVSLLLNGNKKSYIIISHYLFEILSSCQNHSIVKINDEFKLLICDWNEFLKSFERLFADNNKKINEISSIDDLSYFYILYMCHIRRHHIRRFSHYELIANIKQYCPHPCGASNCPWIDKSLPGCQDLENAYYDTDFKCSCLSPYNWNQARLKCEFNDPCKEHPCKQDEVCFSESNHKYKCVLRKDLSDHCMDILSDTGLKGHDACTNGECIPNSTYKINDILIGDKNSAYTCKCKNGFTHDENLSYPNCYKRLSDDPCSIVKGINGYCDNKNHQWQVYLFIKYFSFMLNKVFKNFPLN